jgi:hypothetical protein
MVDSTKENNNDRYTVSVNANCPQGHNAQFQLIATDGTFCDTFEFSKAVGSYNYLVWNPDPTPSSGEVINNTLISLAYSGTLTTSLLAEPTLDIYQSIFVCCGMCANNYHITNGDPEATALVNYLNAGGRVYLEGGDVWYFDPLIGGYNFCPLFGLVGISDGTGDLTNAVGCSGSFTQGMGFSYGGENSYVDHIDPTSGYTVFNSGGFTGYNCGIAYNAGNYRTVGLSFELGGLVDATPPSRKATLLDSIMHFFGIFSMGIEENSTPNPLNQTVILYPNPVRVGDKVQIQLAPLMNTQATLKIYNTAGSCVKTISLVNNKSNVIFWDGTGEFGVVLPAGVYFVHFPTNNKTLIKRVVLVN